MCTLALEDLFDRVHFLAVLGVDGDEHITLENLALVLLGRGHAVIGRMRRWRLSTRYTVDSETVNRA